MFNVKATQHVLAVKDLEKTESYFLDKLGFSVRFRADGWSFLSLGSFHIMLARLIHEGGLKTKIADGILLKNQCVPPRT